MCGKILFVKIVNLIESLWSLMKQRQNKEPTISFAGLKKIALKIWGRSHHPTSNFYTKHTEAY